MALHNRSADAFGVGLAHDPDHLRRLHFGGAVAAFTFTGGTIDLDELSEVATITQKAWDRVLIRLESVSCDLEGRPCGGVPQTLNEAVSRLLIAFS